VININGAAIPVADAYKAALNSRLNLLWIIDNFEPFDDKKSITN
jgi:hypothetical protein